MLGGSLSVSSHHIAIIASALTAGSVAGPAKADPFVFADSFEAALTWSMFEEAVAGNPCGASTGGDVSVVTGGLDGGHGLCVYANKGETLKANHLIAQQHLLAVGPYGEWSMSTWVWVDAETIGSTQTGPEFSLQNTRPIGLVGGDGAQRWRTLTAGVQYVGSQFDSNQGWRVWGIAGPGPEGESETAGWLAMDTPLRFEEDGWYELALSVDFDALTYGSLSIRHQDDEEATVVPLESVSLAREVKFIEGAFRATLEAENLSDCNTATGLQYSATTNPVIYDDVWIVQTAGLIHAPPEAEDLLIDGHLGDELVYELEDLAYDPDGDLDPSTLRVVEAPSQGVVHVDNTLGTLTYVATGSGFKYRVCDATYLCAEAWIYPGWGVSRSGTEEWTGLKASNDALSGLRFGEFNGDDAADVFRADGSKWWISASGTGDWTQLNTSGYTVGSLAFADFDGDGSTDVFRANGSKWWVSWVRIPVDLGTRTARDLGRRSGPLGRIGAERRVEFVRGGRCGGGLVNRWVREFSEWSWA